MNKYQLETPNGDTWAYDDLEDARRDQYLFGGTIKEIPVYVMGTNPIVDDFIKYYEKYGHK